MWRAIMRARARRTSRSWGVDPTLSPPAAGSDLDGAIVPSLAAKRRFAA
jgi:hypothetical protein